MVTCSQSGTNQVFVHTPDGFTMLASQPFDCRLRGIAADGTAAVASCGTGNNFHSFTWTPTDGVVESPQHVSLHAATSNGEFVLGHVVDMATYAQQAMRWSKDGEGEAIADLLNDAGIDVGDVAEFRSALDVSHDGRTFLGEGRDGDSETVYWVARP